MNEIKVNIQDSAYVKTNTIDNVLIKITNVQLFKSVTVVASLFENNKIIDNKVVMIEGTDYNAWSNDDNYIVNFVLNKLGLIKKT